MTCRKLSFSSALLNHWYFPFPLQLDYKDAFLHFDKDSSGKLDKDEMKLWLFPDDDFSTEEPKTLIKEADEDKDGKLSMDEIKKNYKVFVEDEADDSNHDEL